jgi:plastocyanin
MTTRLSAILVVAVFLLAGCGGGGGGGSDSGGNVVKLTDNGFEPNTLTINAGETVKFENDSGDDAWIASNNHPTHLLYPGFDEKKPMVSGGSYSFTFTKVGSWGYHNHLEPTTQGTIVVK